MAKLKLYDATINGVKTQLQLSQEDADRLGDAVTEAKSQEGVANKVGTSSNKQAGTGTPK